MKQPNLKFEKAYFVKDWGDKILHGYATVIKYSDWYDAEKTLFFADGEKLPFLTYESNIFYSLENATAKLIKVKKEHLDYYIKQRDEAIEFIEKATS